MLQDKKLPSGSARHIACLKEGRTTLEESVSLHGIINSARSLSYYTKLQGAVANNLANASSSGYKADRVTARMLAGQTQPIAVDSLDLSQGNIRDTGRSLDLALEGQGFLVVKTPNGERLSRGGSLALDANGQLVDGHGNTVLGQDGPIKLNGKQVEIQPDGTIAVDGKEVGRLRLETVKDLSTLKKEGAGLFVSDKSSEVTDPITVRQGSLEDANVNPLMGTVDLINIQRSYAANIDALKAMDGVMATVTTDVGRV
jgi:flagellar basal-body rod protein FlgF